MSIRKVEINADSGAWFVPPCLYMNRRAEASMAAQLARLDDKAKEEKLKQVGAVLVWI